MCCGQKWRAILVDIFSCFILNSDVQDVLFPSNLFFSPRILSNGNGRFEFTTVGLCRLFKPNTVACACMRERNVQRARAPPHKIPTPPTTEAEEATPTPACLTSSLARPIPSPRRPSLFRSLPPSCRRRRHRLTCVHVLAALAAHHPIAHDPVPQGASTSTSCTRRCTATTSSHRCRPLQTPTAARARRRPLSSAARIRRWRRRLITLDTVATVRPVVVASSSTSRAFARLLAIVHPRRLHCPLGATRRHRL